MTLIFTLSMPSNNSWNGKWSGQGKLYACVRTRPNNIKSREKCAGILQTKYFGHNFGDGWRASIEVRESRGASDVREVRKNSKGFCGYEWMVDNILSHGSASDIVKESAK